jgi:hypothetical protein
VNRGVIVIILALLSVPGGCAKSSSAPVERVYARPIDKAISEGVAFLVNSQTAEGFWGTGLETRGTEIYSMVPGSHDAYRVATTALCVLALREAGETSALDRGVEYLVRHGQARRDNGPIMYNVWAHTYALQALAVEMRYRDDPRVRLAAEWHLDMLRRYETVVGGWNYYDFDAQTQTPSMPPTSFGTAAGLLALWEARKSGIEVPQAMVDRCVRRLEECRLPNGSFLYGNGYKYIPHLPANMVRGSIGRNQSGNFALWLWSSPLVGMNESIKGLDELLENHHWLNMGRKRPFPHEAWYQTSGYYYYFGHYYAAKLLELLPDDLRASYGPRLADCILPYQESDGSWWDYAMWDYHKPYGTAYALMTLLRCRTGSVPPTLTDRSAAPGVSSQVTK